MVARRAAVRMLVRRRGARIGIHPDGGPALRL
jgi:hypothetical protein